VPVNVGGEGADLAALFLPLTELQAAAMGYVPGGVALGLDGSDELAAENVSVSEAITLGFADQLCKAIPRQGETYVGLLSSVTVRGNFSGGFMSWPLTPADLEKANEMANAGFARYIRNSDFSERYPGTTIAAGEELRWAAD